MKLSLLSSLLLSKTRSSGALTKSFVAGVSLIAMMASTPAFANAKILDFFNFGGKQEVEIVDDVETQAVPETIVDPIIQEPFIQPNEQIEIKKDIKPVKAVVIPKIQKPKPTIKPRSYICLLYTSPSPRDRG